jgi:cysteinyl-tRNA synthetase
MSKSLGNIFYIRDYLEKYDGAVLRLALLSGHYRQSINWTSDTISQSKKTLDKYYRILNKFSNVAIDENHLNKCPTKVLSALCDDLNTSIAPAEINEIAKKTVSKDMLFLNLYMYVLPKSDYINS